jgi:hypothetical protein
MNSKQNHFGDHYLSEEDGFETIIDGMLKSPVTDMEEDSTNEIESIINHLRQGYPISSVEADAKQERSPFKVSPVVSPIPAIAIHQIENINSDGSQAKSAILF